MKILVVDDELDVKDLYKQKFRKEIKKHLYDFCFAHSGAEALRIIKGLNHEEALLVLSDINMPGMSGLELLEKLKKNQDSQNAKVMMVSAYGDQQNYNTAKTLGADDFVTKPVDFSLLKEKIKEIS